MKPIIFSTPMVQAILAGRKTQTRRVVKEDRRGEWAAVNDVRNNSEYGASVPCYLHRETAVDDISRNIMYPKYDVGDILWVRETWAKNTDYANPALYIPHGFIHKATGEYHMGVKWRSPVTMPREAARLFLRVTDVRVERVQDILCGDMKREGVIPKTVTGGQYQQWHNDYFKPAWDARNAKRGYGWDSNPFVWVISFERLE